MASSNMKVDTSKIRAWLQNQCTVPVERREPRHVDAFLAPYVFWEDLQSKARLQWVEIALEGFRIAEEFSETIRCGLRIELTPSAGLHHLPPRSLSKLTSEMLFAPLLFADDRQHKCRWFTNSQENQAMDVGEVLGWDNQKFTAEYYFVKSEDPVEEPLRGVSYRRLIDVHPIG